MNDDVVNDGHVAESAPETPVQEPPSSSGETSSKAAGETTAAGDAGNVKKSAVTGKTAASGDAGRQRA